MIDTLPKGWATAPLGEIAQINPRHANGLDDNLPVTFVPMAGLSENTPSFRFSEERPLGEVRKGFTHFAEGDVLFAKITPCMENGKGAVARTLRNAVGCGTTELHVIRPLGGISPEYIYRFLAQSRVRRAAKDNFTGTAGQARVPTSFIEELELPLAPLAEQRRIVAKLEKLLDRVDECQNRLRHIPTILRRFRQSVIAAACSGRLTADWRQEHPETVSAVALMREINDSRRRQASRAVKTKRTSHLMAVEAVPELEHPSGNIPEKWLWVRFGTVIGELRNGISQRPAIDPPGIPILRISAARAGNVDLTDVRYIPNGKEFLPASAIRDGDLLFTRYNGSIDLLGVCGMVRGLGKRHVLYPDKLMRVRFDHTFIAPAYAEIFFQASNVHDRIVERSKSSAGQNGVSGSDIKMQPFALAPLAEQHEIIRRVETLFALAARIEARFVAARAQVDKLTPSLLAKAFRGELVSTETLLAAEEGRSYEDATHLLKRIREHRATGSISRSNGAPASQRGRPH